jgi:hypothetical protein
MSQVQIDNTAFDLKVSLRYDNLPSPRSSKLSVLDAYSGTGKIWDVVKSKKDLSVIGIDKKVVPGRIILQGDNEKFVRTMDLSNFDVLDFDAYGCPFPVMDAAFHNQTLTQARMFFTFIRRMKGSMHKKMLFKLGYTESMYIKIKTLFSNNGFTHFINYLSLWGVKKVMYYKLQKGEYYYGFFDFSR